MAEKDIAPGLFSKIQKQFENSINSSDAAGKLLDKITKGTASYTDAEKFADVIGESLSSAFEQNLSSDVLPDGKMYWNIAQEVVEPMFRESYDITKAATHDVQTSINARHNIHLKAQDPKYHKRHAEAIMGELCEAEHYDDVAYVLKDSAEAYSLSVVDEALKNNVDFQGQNGYKAKVIRRAGAGCCSWCADLEGEYEYPDVPDGVYARHDYCKCAVDYDPGDHSGQVQDVWSKENLSAKDAEKLEDRKTYGLERKWTQKDGKRVKANR
ncbi:MAG: hypothetical protein LUD72_07725 [Bacteroidales bacterium]|nr:hypothetical protein [Bacteroidales bacterium]